MAVVSLSGVECQLSEDTDDKNIWMACSDVGRDDTKVDDGTEGLIWPSRVVVRSIDNVVSEDIEVVVG